MALQTRQVFHYQMQSCHCSSSTRRWACPCGTAWIACMQHRADGFLRRGLLRQPSITMKLDSPGDSSQPRPKRRRLADPTWPLFDTGLRMSDSYSNSSSSHHYPPQPSGTCSGCNRSCKGISLGREGLVGVTFHTNSVLSGSLTERALHFTPGPLTGQAFLFHHC